MTQTVEAVYEDGILRPIQPLQGIAEQCKVKVTVEVGEAAAHPMADCIGIMPDDDADDLRRIIADEFEQVNLNDWR